MAARFESLHEVAQVLSEHIREELGIVDVQAGPPRDVSATIEAGARITLLYLTPQAGHRNDPPERRADGVRRFPPLALSCFFLVTTSGVDSEEPVAAHHALGRIMTLYHDQPSLTLPLADNAGADPGAFTRIGEGVMSVLQVPMTLEQIDKIWTSLDSQLQPWALFEVSPVQLVSMLPDAAPAPIVRPGGVNLGIATGDRPVVVRLTPQPVRQGGRVRVDAALAGTLESLVVAGVDVGAGDSALTVSDDGSVMLLSLDDDLAALPSGGHPLSVRASGLVSRRATLTVADPAAPVVDAPARHDPTNDLLLTGANLAEATGAVLWPDGEVTDPTQLHALPVGSTTSGSVTVPSASLTALPSRAGPWRVTVRVGELFTPHVILELRR